MKPINVSVLTIVLNLQHCFFSFVTFTKIIFLFKLPYITRFLSGLLLLVFTLGITPKRFLHNAFAKHTDANFKKTTDKPFQVNKSGFNCDCDNLVAESSFVVDLQEFNFPLFTSFSSYLIKNISYSSISEIYSQLRGPPAKIN